MTKRTTEAHPTPPETPEKAEATTRSAIREEAIGGFIDAIIEANAKKDTDDVAKGILANKERGMVRVTIQTWSEGEMHSLQRTAAELAVEHGMDAFEDEWETYAFGAGSRFTSSRRFIVDDTWLNSEHSRRNE